MNVRTLVLTWLLVMPSANTFAREAPTVTSPRVAAVAAVAPDHTVWHSPLGMMSAPSSALQLDRGSYGNTLGVKSTVQADLQWLTLPLALADNLRIKGITLCYRVTNPRSFISQIRLAEEQVPPSATVRHDDGTDRTSTTGECVTSQVGGLQVDGAITLALRLNFGNTADTISIGAIGVKVGS